MQTDSEINEAVARKLGWEDSDYPAKGWFKRTVNGKEEYTDGFDPEHYDYCHSIEAAWEVVEYLHKNGYRVTLPWMCSSNAQAVILPVCSRPETAWIATEDTAPMAICLAFLKLP